LDSSDLFNVRWRLEATAAAMVFPGLWRRAWARHSIASIREHPRHPRLHSAIGGGIE
jgi:hypothetical protein